eukprot:3550644-Prymnesium_polylepis.1
MGPQVRIAQPGARSAPALAAGLYRTRVEAGLAAGRHDFLPVAVDGQCQNEAGHQVTLRSAR